MATPGTALPGSVVPASSLVGSSGAQGIQGIQGIIGVAGDAEVGSIKVWPSVTPPTAWMLLDHSAISRTLYPDLFALIGTNFGVGDGSTTFNLPDARGCFILNMGQSSANGNTPHSLADTGGEEAHQLIIAELAQHTHVQNAHSHNTTLPSQSAQQTAAGGGLYAVNAAAAQGSTATTAVNQNTGGNTAHNTMPPFLCLVYIIKVSKGGGPTAQAPIANQTQAGLLNIISGNFGDYIGGDNASHPLLAPTIEYYDQDDCISCLPISATLAVTKLLRVDNSGAAGAVSGNWQINMTGHPGIIQLAPGSVAQAYARAFVNQRFAIDANITLTIQAVLYQLSTGFSGPQQYFFGLTDNPGPVINAANNYSGFFWAASSGANFLSYSRAASVVTAPDSGVPILIGGASAWHKLKLVFSQGQTSFYIDEVLITTISDSSVPANTVLMWPGLWTNNSTGTLNGTVVLDAFDILIQVVPQAGGPSTRFMRRIL